LAAVGTGREKLGAYSCARCERTEKPGVENHPSRSRAEYAKSPTPKDARVSKDAFATIILRISPGSLCIFQLKSASAAAGSSVRERLYFSKLARMFIYIILQELKKNKRKLIEIDIFFDFF
jgi:hypothetical protein